MNIEQSLMNMRYQVPGTDYWYHLKTENYPFLTLCYDSIYFSPITWWCWSKYEGCRSSSYQVLQDL